MIPIISWNLFGLGMLAGSIAAGFYLAGLAWTIRMALRRPDAGVLLLLSSATRIALLLCAGAATALTGAPAAAGFAVSFIVVRTVTLLLVRQRIV